MKVDVAIIGGGPAGSTCASLLRKYNPRLKVLVLEREQFPRDHVGESQLPQIGSYLHELGVWDKVERAGFPIKIGATYRWGQTDDLWDFQFLPNGEFQDQQRPAPYAGQRTRTAFQVDRAIYDKILLDHSRELGANVQERRTVRQVKRTGDRVDGLVLEDGSEVTAKYYVDASGHTGVLRRAMGVETKSPTTLQNIAIWDYWQNAEWAVSIGVGGTRVQVLSLGYGWIWFIPLGPTRTSIGLIVPASYYKTCGKKPAELYQEAITSDPIVSKLIRNATSEEKLATTKDWSFLADRLAGENWFLAGESAGFADPILAAGMTLAHASARDAAYAILAETRNDLPGDWLREWYDRANRRRISHHLRFAEFWYTANGHFKDLKDHTSFIAQTAGLSLPPDQAWQWLGTGGFVDIDQGTAGVGGYNLVAVRGIFDAFTQHESAWAIGSGNHFTLQTEGATRDWVAFLKDGRIERARTLVRNDKYLPLRGEYGALVQALKEPKFFDELIDAVSITGAVAVMTDAEYQRYLSNILECLEAMVLDGWVSVKSDPNRPSLAGIQPQMTNWMARNQDMRHLSDPVLV